MSKNKKFDVAIVATEIVVYAGSMVLSALILRRDIRRLRKMVKK